MGKNDSKDLSALNAEQLQEELKKSQQAASDNLELAKMAEQKVSETMEEVESLRKQLAEASSKDATIEALDKDNKQLKAMVVDLQTEVAELKEELTAEQESNPTHKEQFTHNEKTYEVLVAEAKIPGVSEKPMTALEICNSDEAKEKLVRTNSGLIREIK